MIVLAPPLPPRLATRVSIPPTEVHWTAEEFLRLGDSGLLEGRRAMLIEGTILEEGPMNPPHRIGLELTTEALRTKFTVAVDGSVAPLAVPGVTVAVAALLP